MYDEGDYEDVMKCERCGKVLTLTEHRIWKLEKKVARLKEELKLFDVMRI